ncbi:uncharacterized protein LOC122882624 isoform X5 [Siniperca chuatsi]|uniref:uncharacterized protein LOC122882624 isoform X5 n=1 Tax=Siniperca chuatsi TaxID=119488 RepID=UPI001CE030F7|nr:uncharacterized protein LOC122882624 isoform X5 [Siniperca chuatsi]
MGAKTVEEPRKEKTRENLNGNADVVVFISSDDDVVDVTMEQKMETRVKEERVQPQQIKRVEQAEAAVDEGNQGSSSYSSDTLLRFIRRYCSDNVDANSNFNTSTDTQVSGPSVPAVLSPTHPRDIIQACYRSPYCLYLYVGVELGGGQSASVVLIGYLDQSSGFGVVRLLHALEMTVDTFDPPTSADTSTDTITGTHADAQFLIETLKKLGLPLSNLAVFYCNAPHLGVSQVFVSQLQAFNPGLVSLCGLSGIAGRACQAGLLASFRCVVDLVRDIHHHYSTCPSVNDSLKKLFADAKPYNPSHSISAQCLFIINTVQKMVSSWRDLVDYFKSLRQAEDADRIRAQLMDHKVKLKFLFLSQTLEPLRALQELQQYGTADVAVELQLTSMLVHSYAASLLRPSVAESFLRRRELHVLHNEMKLLPTTEVNVGSRARDFLWATADVDLREQERRDFLKDAADFYKAALQSLVESIPKQLGDVALRNIGKVLKHPENINDSKLSRRVLLELGVQLGLCKAGSPEQHQLACDYLNVIKAAKEEQASGTGEGHCWAKMLRSIRPYSVLHRLLLTLLALPSSLCRTQVFAKVFSSTKGLLDSKETSKASPQPGRWAGRPRICRRKLPVQAGNGGKKKEEEAGETSSEDCDSFVAKPGLNIPSKHYSNPDDSDYTDNSSDVVDVTEESKMFRTSTLIKAESQRTPEAETVFVVGDDDDDDDCMVSTSTAPDSAELLIKSTDATGELVWGQVEGFSLWPAIIVPCRGEVQLPGKRMVEWYGQRMSSWIPLFVLYQMSTQFLYRSLVCMKALKPFAAFAQHFSANSFAILVTYREAIFLSLQEAALRCKKQFSASLEDRDELLKQMLDWAFGGFQPTGPDGLKPGAATNEETIRRIMDTKLDIEGFCLCCGTEKIEIFHPLFKGSLCLECKDNLTETLYRYDDDGYQSYCTICCYGLEVILCGNDSCCRSYCADCLNILVGPGTFDSLKLLDPWICYMCQPHRPHGALIPREDWSIRVQELFANNSAMEFEPHRVYPSIPANLRRPVRVLSLFDGIATGHLVLKDLGFKVEKYVASEVCEDSIAVAAVNHDGKIIHVGDARFITQEHIEQWGPFDLLIGGSPCNDLSIVNPIRKGLYEGTGRLFFDYYRILQLLKPKEEDPRPFFWLFENVVFMNTHDKVNICRFLECNPVLVDAVKVSPAHRARYFWGNIPGMSRPIIASQNDKLSLQDCLEIGREARVTKVRTITTNANSLKQGKDVSQLPVLQHGREDNLWITELEKIFGFPKHYTDVRNMNRQQRQKVLGKAWSVPVIRHLFAPLKDYFACEELPPLTTSTSSTSPSSPASPELQQLR